MSYQGNTGCSCGGGGTSSGGGTTVVCSRPSIPVAVPGMCLSDGTPIAIISTRAKDGTWVRTGWLNLATGGFTAGRPPASAKPCNPNDNGGGGEPATLAGVHVEDWCDVDADGNVLSPVLAKYTVDDAGAIVGVEFLTPDGEPYEVQGTLGICNTDGPSDLTGRELVRLCDVADDGTITVFVRDYERDSTGAVTGFTDYDIDGQPYTPSGEVTSCDTAQPEEECASPTTPIATTGLCLADGTPIATVATRDCDGVVSTDGWINLLTNTYTAGQPPAGARACGETSAFDVSGVLCDVNESGDVLGLVLIEVERGTDGEITGTRLINAADGSEYTLQGELTVCPAGVEQPEKDLIELCDLTDDGEGTTATRFLRDYTRDENGAIVGYTDYTLDGQPYTPTGEVASCDDVPGEPAQPERDLIRLCDSVDEGEDTTVTVFVRDYERDDTGAIVSYSDYDLDGQPYTPVGEIGACEEALEAPTREHDLVRLCDSIDSGEDVETVEFIRDYERDTNGQIVGHSDYTLDGQPYEPQGEVGQCRDTEERCEQTTSLLRLCDLNPDTPPDSDGKICAVPFLRHLVHDCDGNVVSHHDTEPDGTTPYTPVQVVDCATHTPALVEVPWVTVSVEEDPNGPERQAFIFKISPEDDPDTVGTVRVQTSRAAGGACGDYDLDRLLFSNTAGYTIELDEVAQSVSSFKVNLVDFDGFEPVQITGPAPDRLGGTATWNDAGNRIVPTEDNGTGEMYWDNPPPEIAYTIWNTGGGNSCSMLSFEAITFKPEGCCTCDTTNGGDPGEPVPEFDAAPVVLCDNTEDGEKVLFLRSYRVDNATGEVTGHTDTTLDGTTPYTPVGEVGACGEETEPCRDTQTLLLCEIDDVERVTVFDPASRPGSDGWEVVSFTGAQAGYGPEAAIPYPAPHPTNNPNFMGARSDLYAGPGGGWTGYEAAPIRWVLRKTFTASEDGIAVVESLGFRGDGGARVRVNGQDAGMYGQWNQPATTGTAKIPVTAGPNIIEIEARDVGGDNWVQGRLDIMMTRTTQFLRTLVTDCETHAVVEVIDTTLDGQPYTVEGEVSSCQPAAGGGGGSEPAPPETRVDVEGELLCLLDADGAVLREVWVERVYDDQTSDLIDQRVTDPATTAPVEVPAGATIGRCAAPDEEPEDRFEVEAVPMCVLDADGEVVRQVLVEHVYDTATGERTETRNVDPVTGEPVELAEGETIGQCVEPCRDTQTMLLCDLADDGEVTASTTDVTPPPYSDSFVPLPGGGGALWSGGTLQFPADPDASAGDGSQIYRTVAGQITAAPECGDTGRITVSVRVRNDGPGDGLGTSGGLRLYRGDTIIAQSGVPMGAPAGYVGTLTASAGVTADDLTSGALVAVVWLETFHGTAKAWTVDQYETVLDWEKCPTQFMRNVVVDCETGETISTHDTTLDGQPYEVTGEVEQCQPANTGNDPLPEFDAAPVVLCDTIDGGEDVETVEFLRSYRVDNSTGVIVGYTDTTLDGDTPYEPQGEVGQCQGSGGDCCDEPSQDIRCETFVLCDTGPDGDDPVSFMRAVCRDSTGVVVSVTDTELDAITPYTVRS